MPNVIFGLTQSNGTILGATQYSEDTMLLPLLNKHFNTYEKAYDLICIGLWDKLCDKKSLAKVDKAFKSIYGAVYAKTPNHNVSQLHKAYILADTRYVSAAPVIYSSVADLRKFATVYLFDATQRKWQYYARE